MTLQKFEFMTRHRETSLGREKGIFSNSLVGGGGATSEFRTDFFFLRQFNLLIHHRMSTHNTQWPDRRFEATNLYPKTRHSSLIIHLSIDGLVEYNFSSHSLPSTITANEASDSFLDGLRSIFTTIVCVHEYVCVGTYGYRILRNPIFFRNAVKPSLDESFLLSTMLANDEVHPCSPTSPARSELERK